MRSKVAERTRAWKMLRDLSQARAFSPDSRACFISTACGLGALAILSGGAWDMELTHNLLML